MITNSIHYVKSIRIEDARWNERKPGCHAYADRSVIIETDGGEEIKINLFATAITKIMTAAEIDACEMQAKEDAHHDAAERAAGDPLTAVS